MAQKKEIEERKLQQMSQNSASKVELEEVKENQARLMTQFNHFQNYLSDSMSSIKDTLQLVVSKVDKI
jgi:flagellar hook-associated protein FlgK